MQKNVIGFDHSAGLPILATHTFSTTDDGQLQHAIDGKLRAIVPPEGWGDYVKAWPEAGDVIDSLRIVPVAVAVEVAQEQTPAEKIAVMEAALAALKAENVVAA